MTIGGDSFGGATSSISALDSSSTGGAIFLGASSIPIKKMETMLNKEAAQGWQVVFQLVERKRLMLFWTREAVIVTLGR